MNNHNIVDLDLFYSDAKRLINDVILDGFDDDIIKTITKLINGFIEDWHGKDAVIQINRLIEEKNSLIDSRDIIGNIGVYISMLVKNYRDAQNSNVEVLPSFVQLDYKKSPKSELLNNTTEEVYMNSSINGTVSYLDSFVVSLKDLSNTVLDIKDSILNNWIQEDENRDYASKMFMKFDENIVNSINNINDINKSICSAIEKYNESLNKISAMPSLESMVAGAVTNKQEHTQEEKVVLNSVKKNFEIYRNLNKRFNSALVNEVKKDLTDKGVL